MSTQYTNYAVALLQGLVDHPEDVKVEETTDERGVLLLANVHREDMGKVIGIGGKNINGIKALVNACGARLKVRVALKLNEPDGRDNHNRKQDQGAQDSEG